MLDGFEEHIAQRDWHHVDRNRGRATRLFNNGGGVAAAEDIHLSAARSHVLNTRDAKVRHRRIGTEAQHDSAVLLAYVVKRQIRHELSVINDADAIRNPLDLRYLV